MSGIKKANLTFLATLVAIEVVSFIGIRSMLQSYTSRLIVSQLTLFIPCLLYILYCRMPLRKVIRLNKLPFTDILLCVVFFILIRPLITLINAFSMLYSTNTISEHIFSMQNEVPLLIGIIVSAVIPAIVEESLYRGVCYNEYRKAKPLAAIFLSGLMFGIMHRNLNQFSYAFVMGVIFALLIEATNSILSTMTIHFLTNALSTVLIYFLPLALDFLERMYHEAVAGGDEALARYLVELVGADGFSMDNIMRSAQSIDRTAVLATIVSSFFPAIIAAVLAFFVYRSIAKRNGRWEYIKSIFSKEARNKYEMKCNQARYRAAIDGNQTEYHADGNGEDGSDCYVTMLNERNGRPEKVWIIGEGDMPTGERLFTWALVAGMILCVADLVLNELVIRGIIVF